MFTLEMKIKLKKSLEDTSFFGRISEKDRVAKFLDNKLGGTLLIAGERGAGKTSLIDNVLDEKAQSKRSRYSVLRYTRSECVRVELPFLPKHLRSSNSNEPEKYKAELTSLILKALVQALATENESRINSKTDIRTKWFRPQGYNRELDALDKLTRYTSITEKIGKSVSIPKVNIGGKHELAFDHDLSDTIIEVKLRRLLQTYSDQLRFVFVFDELDKLNNLEAVDFVYYLKNLFTHSGSHFIFITTDKVYLDIEKIISVSPYDIEHTLFTEKILLNNLSPKDFNQWLAGYFAESEQKQSFEYYLMAYTIAWQTKQHPYDALNLLKRSQTKISEEYFIDTEILRGLLDSLTWTYHSTMQTFIDYVYTNHSDRNDNYFNMILYKSLRTAAQYVIEGQQKLINRQSFLTALYIANNFNDASEELTSKHDVLPLRIPRYKFDKVNDWRLDIPSMPTNQIERIEKSLLNLYFLLHREGSLKLSPTSEMPDDNHLLHAEFIGDAFNVYNLKLPFFDSSKGFDSLYNPTEYMEQLKAESTSRNIEFYALFNRNFWMYAQTSLFEYENFKDPAAVPTFSANYRYLLDTDLRRYADHLGKRELTMKTKIIEELNRNLREKKFAATQFSLNSEQNIVATSGSTYKTYKVVFDQSYPKKGDGIGSNEHIFNLKSSNIEKKSRRVRRDNWQDISTGKAFSRIYLSIETLVNRIILLETKKT